MKDSQLIPIKDLCTHYQVEMTFFNELKSHGLIEVVTMEETYCVHQDHIANLEKMIRLHNELNLNFEGIDTVFNMLEKIEDLKTELNAVKNRLRRYEDF
ncbi:MAG: MerR family transcriptional regulator [Algicola sp.]|nr:MerR family transcriptional regulator [Algicola sp.]